jgi:UDP-glucuronate 4-epimerase
LTVAVTGCAGFIGYHLANRILDRNEDVVGIDCVNDYYDPQLKQDRIADLQKKYGSRFQFVKVDFSDDAALDKALGSHDFQHIAHLGAQAGVRYSIDNPRAYVQANLVGHLNVLEVARARMVPMVYASSSSVYGGNTNSPFSVDDRVDHPLSLYAATKKADELMSETYAHLYRMPLTGLRFFTVYGPWGRPDMAMWIFAKAILEGTPIKLFNNGDMRRDFTYIDDIVSGIDACLNKPPVDDGSVKAGGSTGPHSIYNIGNRKSEELTDMIAILEECCGKKAIREMYPMQDGDVKDTFADIDAISNDLGYKPTTTIAQGIPKFIDWYRGYHLL